MEKNKQEELEYTIPTREEIIEDILKRPANTNALASTVTLVARKLKNVLTEEDIYKRLEDNHFKGIYFVSNKEFSKLQERGQEIAFYNNFYNVIICNEDKCLNARDVMNHELVHAFITSLIEKSILVGDKAHSYGIGYEEGLAAIIGSIDNLDNLTEYTPCSYSTNVFILKQLNELYLRTDNRKYNNLIELMFKEPEKFFKTILDTYFQILCKFVDATHADYSIKEIFDISFHSLLNMTVISDIFVESLCFDKFTNTQLNDFFCLARDINSTYFAYSEITKLDFEPTDKIEHQLFLFNRRFIYPRPEQEELAFLIFNKEAYQDYVRMIELLLSISVNKLDDLSDNNKTLQKN